MPYLDDEDTLILHNWQKVNSDLNTKMFRKHSLGITASLVLLFIIFDITWVQTANNKLPYVTSHYFCFSTSFD